MTANEYAKHETEVFDKYKIPQEFRGPISYHAWEQGHSNGYGEVAIHLEDLIDGLAPAIKEFQKRITAEAYSRKQQ